MDNKNNKIIYFKNNIDKDKFNEYYKIIKKYIDSNYYDDKYNKYFIEFINTYRHLEATNEVDVTMRRLRNYIMHKSHYEYASKCFTANFKYYLTLHRKTVSDISKDLNIPYSTVNDWYNGKKYPRIDKISMLAEYFGVSTIALTKDHKVDNKGAVVPVLGNIPARYTY